MSNSHPQSWVVTLVYVEEGLSDVMALNSAMMDAGFKSALPDEQGHAHPLPTNSFGLVSPSSEQEIVQYAQGLAGMALGHKPEVKIETLEAFLRQNSVKRD